MPLKAKSEVYENAVELAKEFLKGGGTGMIGSIGDIIERIFQALKKINEEEEYPEYK